MITTVTLNPMLDKTVRVQRISPGRIMRADAVTSIVGGKGVNVARQLLRLGCDVRATGLWGGEVGNQLDRLLNEEGMPHDFVRIAGMTREGVTYVDADGVMTSVFEPPHAVTARDAGEMKAKSRSLVAGSSWMVCCGSSPGPACDAVYEDVLRDARAGGVRTALDTYGEALRLGLNAVPDLVKVNREEYQNTIGVTLDAESHIIDALMALVEEGVGLAVLTDGARPCYAAGPPGCWKITPPAVASVNPTGSGDSMMAGILYGLTRGWDPPRCVSFGAAAGAANAAVWDVSAVTQEDIMALLPRMSILELDFS